MKRLLGVVGVLLLAVLVYFLIGIVSFHVLSPSDSPSSESRPGERVEVDRILDSMSPRGDTQTASRSANQPRIAIVIDDLGWNLRTASLYDQIQVPLTMALLPERPRSRDLYNRWKNKFEFIIHVPMEPKGYPEDDPGRMALMTDMSSEEIHRRLRLILKNYPMAVGINNHMGSAFTTERDLMRAVMDVLKERGLYYFDSGTTAGSLALQVARKVGVRAMENQVFLDHTRSAEFVNKQLDELVRIAREEGQAVGIGHVQSMTTARVLEERLPQIESRGIQFVPLSELMGVSRLTARP
jgi:polysaccharide deacetylase 2 family uncharacterized protein YibQ